MTEELAKFGIIFLRVLFNLIYASIFAYILLSWFMKRSNPIMRTLTQVVTPILAPFRWARLGMLDFSPIVALFMVDIVGNFLGNLLHQTFITT